jgi:hypothetical protein
MEETKNNRARNAVRTLSALVGIGVIFASGCSQSKTSGGQFIAHPPTADERITAIQNDPTMQPAAKEQMIAMIRANSKAAPAKLLPQSGN